MLVLRWWKNLCEINCLTVIKNESIIASDKWQEKLN